MLHVLFQVFFTFVPYYLIAYPSYCSVWKAAGIIALGIGATILEYEVDRQKELFRTTGGNCKIWGKPAKFLVLYIVFYICIFATLNNVGSNP